jgi:4a-hydroxytetrahydrobiopterin dehydratase
MIKTLSPEEIQRELTGLPGWSYAQDPSSPESPEVGGKISKQFEFRDFMDSLGFVDQMAPYFEAMDHHPDVTITYSKVRFDLQRFDAGGKVTDRDIEVAKEIEKAYAARSQT